ncbi:type II toxin-antitoxin system TacA family antitoxin [Bradyrhizobium liaoningense]
MPRAVERKEHPLSMRLPETDIAIIDRAAALRGRSRTDFVRDAAVRAAEDVLMETAPIRMSPSGFRAFMATLSGPAAPVPEMVELSQRAAPWESKAPSSEVDAGSRKQDVSNRKIRPSKKR